MQTPHAWSIQGFRAGLRADLEAARARVLERVQDRSYPHFRRLEAWVYVCTGLGWATAWVAPNPISILLIGIGNVTRWSILGHHICHRAFDREPGAAPRHTSRVFARGWRRFLDWPDWFLPGAWRFEHNVLHHYHTGETLDPDLVERNFTLMRRVRGLRPLKIAIIAFLMCTWKLLYYAPNTLWLYRMRRELKGSKASPHRLDEVMAVKATNAYHGVEVLLPVTRGGLEFWGRCVLPFVAWRFVLLPLAFLPLGRWAVISVFVNSVLAEVYANLHSFAIIVPSHAGEDLHRYHDPIASKDDFYLRQVLGSANYTSGHPVFDFLQGYLNYQIEHHLWPDLSPLAYRELRPEVRAVCEEHGVPYIEESVFRRLSRTVAIMVGERSMKSTLASDAALPAPP